jgi:hypothetical protein
MNHNPKTWIVRFTATLKSCRTALASFIRKHCEARTRRIEQEKEFYRKFAAYCRSNNLPAVCAEDWKTAAYSKDR